VQMCRRCETVNRNAECFCYGDVASHILYVFLFFASETFCDNEA